MVTRTRNARFRAALVGSVGGAAAAAAAVGGLGGAAQAEPLTTDDPQLVTYVEVNGHDFGNIADYTLEGTGEAAVDIGIIFAANINYDGEQAQLHLNERVTETLADAENQIRPVQAQGTKVLLSILGNHQGAGFANFTSYAQADAFAAQLEGVVDTYGLDGIDFDDEYSNYGVDGTPLPNAQSFGWLLESLRERLGDDKLITLYAIGETYTDTDFSAIDTEALVDYAWNPYYTTYNAPSVDGLDDPARLGAAAADIQNTSRATAGQYAQRTVADGYGIYVTYDLRGEDTSAYFSAITSQLDGRNTVYQADHDTTSPTVTVKDGAPFTTKDGDSYEQVSYKLYDEGKIDTVSVNGVEKDLVDNTWSDLNFLRPGVFGGVEGNNLVEVTDVAGNTTTVEVALTR